MLFFFLHNHDIILICVITINFKKKMILYRTKYYSDDAGLSLYDSFKKAYDSHKNHPKWMEDLKKECDDYISSYKDNPSNNRFAGWLIEHSPTGKEEKDRLTKLARNSENDLIDRYIDGPEFPKGVKKNFEDSKSALEHYIETMLGDKQQKELLDRINEGESYRQNLEKARDFLGNNNSRLTDDKELMKLVSDYRESLEKVVKISEDELSEEISKLNTKVGLLYKDQNLIKDILTNDPVTTDVPESFKFKGKTVSLSFDEMGRYMKLQEVAEERFLSDILSQKDGLDKFLGHIYPLTGGSPDKLDAIKSKILEETKNITDPKKKLDITLKNLGVKNKEELFTRFLQECSGYYKCDSIKDTIAKLVSDPKAAGDCGFTAKNIQELKKVLDDTAAENVLNKYVMSDPKSLENVVINLEKTEKDIELARAHARIGKKTVYGDIPDFDKNPPANNAAPANVVKDATTGEVKPSLWKSAVKWVKENPWKSGLIGLGALSIGFAVHQSLKKKEERREERNRDKFDRWKNKFNN